MITINIGDKELNVSGLEPDPMEDQDPNAPIIIKVGKQATRIRLNIRKTLDNNFIIYDHDLIEIIIVPDKNKVITVPKVNTTTDTYPAQNRYFEMLEKKGITIRGTIRSGPVYNSLEAYYPVNEEINVLQVVILATKRFIDIEKEMHDTAKDYDDNIEDMFLEPDEDDSTELGEIPHDRPGNFPI
jgi:hypothetical protein